MSKSPTNNYHFKVGALTLLATSLGVAGLSQTVHADVAAPTQNESQPSAVQQVAPSVNANQEASHIQVTTQPQAQTSTAPAAPAVKAPSVSDVTRVPQQTPAPTQSAQAPASPEAPAAQPAPSQPAAATNGATNQPQQPASTKTIQPQATQPAVTVNAASQANTETVKIPKINSVHISAPVVSTNAQSTTSIKFTGVVSSAQSENVSQTASQSDTTAAPTITPIKATAVSTSEAPKFTIAPMDLQNDTDQPVATNPQNPQVSRDGQANLTTVRAADIAKVTPATNLIASQNPSALGKQVVSNLDANRVGKNVTQLIAQADAALPTATGYAALNNDQLGQTVKTNLMKLTNPVQTTALGDVDDATFDQAKTQANQTYASTGVPQVLTRSSATAAPVTTIDAAAGTNSVANLLDPTGAQRAAAQLTNPSTTDSAATQTANLLGKTGASLQNQLQTNLAATPTALSSTLTSSDLTTVKPTAAVVGATTDATATGDNQAAATLATAVQPQSIFSGLSDLLTTITNGVKTGIANAANSGSVLSDVLKSLNPNNVKTALQNFVTSLTKNGPLADVVNNVQSVIKTLTSGGDVATNITNVANSLKAFLTSNNVEEMGKSLAQAVSSLGNNSIITGLASGIQSVFTNLAKNATGVQSFIDNVSDTLKGLVSPSGTIGQLISAVSDRSNPLSTIVTTAKSDLTNAMSDIGTILQNESSGKLTEDQANLAIQNLSVAAKKAIDNGVTMPTASAATTTATSATTTDSNPLSGIIDWAKNTFSGISDTVSNILSGFTPSKILNDAINLIKWPDAQTIPNILKNAGEIGTQLLNFFGIPGLSDLLNQGSGKATTSGSATDILTNLKNTVNNSIIGTLIGTLTNKQDRAKATITWVDPNATDRDKFLRKDGKPTTTPNPNYGKKLFAKGINDPAYQAEDTGQTTDPTLQKLYGENNSFKVADMLTQDHSATMPENGSWELDGPDEMTPDHRYLTSIRIMPENTGLAAIGNLASSTTSMSMIMPYALGSSTTTSLASSDSQPLKDGFNFRGWSPIVAFDNVAGLVAGPLQGGTWHSPLIDRTNGNYGIWLRMVYPKGVDARSMAESIDWWSAINMQNTMVTAALGILPVTIADWSTEWYPRYTSWTPDDPNAIYFLARGKKAGGADWNKIQHVDNVGGANVQETIDAILHPKSPLDILNAIKNFNFLTPQSDPIDGTMVPNGALGIWNTTNLVLSAWNQLPIIGELGTLYGVGNFSYNVHIDRYSGNYSTQEMADILQAQGKIKNANDATEVAAYKAAHPDDFSAVDDSEGKSMTKGTLPPSANGRLSVGWAALDNFAYNRDPKNPNLTDIANGAIRVPQRDIAGLNTTDNGVKTWHDYVVVNSDENIKLNRATDGSFTDQPDGGRTLALYGKTTATGDPIFSIRNFFEKQADGSDTDVTQNYLNSGLKTINISTNASKASGNLGPNGKPAIVPVSNLDADPGNLKAGTKNVYDNVIHINGTALDGSSFLKTGDVPVEQTVNGTTIRNTTPQPGTMPSASTFPLKSLTQLSELKKGNDVTIQFKADEVDQDGKVISAGKWTALPDNLGTIKASGGYDPLSIPLDSLGLQNGHKYSISYQATDPYGFKTLVDKPTVIQVGQKQGYQLKYVDDSGNQLATSQFIASDNANEIVNPVDKVVTVPGYTLSSININGAPYEGGTISVPTKRNWTITYTYEKSA